MADHPTYISLIIVGICVFFAVVIYFMNYSITVSLVNDARASIYKFGNFSTAVERCEAYFPIRNNLLPDKRTECDSICLDIICKYEDMGKCMLYKTFIEKQKGIF